MSSQQSLISASDLNNVISTPKLLNSNRVVVLYTTMVSGPGIKPDIISKNPTSYIPDSIAFDFQDQFADPNSTLSNTMVSAATFATEADALGLQTSDTLIIYDDYGNFCASRVWFMFKSMGHQNVHVLDGGLPAYLRAKLPTVTELMSPKPNTSPSYTCTPNLDFTFVDKEAVVNNLHTQTEHVIDARSKERFLGSSPEMKTGVRAGHIPNSSNIYYADLQDVHGHFLAIPDLKSILDAYSEQSLIFSCGSGVTACVVAQAVFMTGVRKLKVYDGSWSQWGADHNLPIKSTA